MIALNRNRGTTTSPTKAIAGTSKPEILMKLATSTFLLSLGAGLLLMAVQDPLMGLGLLAWTVGVNHLGKRTWDEYR